MKRAITRACVAAALFAATGMAQLTTAWIEAGGTRRHSVYVGTSTNWITVKGNGNSDLDCWVYDADGNLVDSDMDDTDYCILETPGVGMHRVTVENVGGRSNRYVVTRKATL